MTQAGASSSVVASAMRCHEGEEAEGVEQLLGVDARARATADRLLAQGVSS